MMFNLTFFDGSDCGPRPDQSGEGEGHAGWELATAAAVPSCLLVVIVVLLLVRQNLESLRGLIDSINQLIASLASCLAMRVDAVDEQVEMDAVVVQSPARRCPRNLSDEEVIAMQSRAPPGAVYL